MPKTIAFKTLPEVSERDGYTRIVLRDMAVNVRIGVYPEEKTGQKQEILVNAELYTGMKYLRGVNPDSIIDYSKVIAAVQGWENREHVLLVETYMSELLDICFALEGVESCRLSILKTEICKEAQGVGVEVFMTRAEYNS